MMSIHYSNSSGGGNSRATNVRGRTESPRSRHATLGTYDASIFGNTAAAAATKSNLLSRRTPSQQKQYAATEQFVNYDYDAYEEDSFVQLNNNRNRSTLANPLPLSSSSYGLNRQQGNSSGGVQLQSLNNSNTSYFNNQSATLMQPSSHSRQTATYFSKPTTITTASTQQRPRVSDLYSYNATKGGGGGGTSTVGLPKYTTSIVNSNSGNLLLGSSNSAELVHKQSLENNLGQLNLNDPRQATTTYQQDSSSMGSGYAGTSKNNFRTRRSQFNLFDGNSTSSTSKPPTMTANHVMNGAGSSVYSSNGASYSGYGGAQQHSQSSTAAYPSKSGEGITQFYANQYQAVYKPSNQQTNLLPSPSSTSSSSSSSPPLHNSLANNNGNSINGANYGYTYGATQFYVNSGANYSNAQNYGNDADATRGVVGLKNLGNTCFMNSILQCLSNTRCLLEYCLSGSYTGDINTTLSVMKGALFNSYASLIKKMWKNEDVISPKEFKDQIARFAPRFVGYAQQDAEEFLYYLLKGLHEDVNLIRKKPTPVKFDEKAWDRMNDQEKSQKHWSMNLETDNSRISDMFVGQLKSTLKCTECNYKSPTFELFWHLAVPIPKKSSIDLHDCLSQFMLEEVLEGDNKPFCSRCKEKRRCTKRYTIEKLPKILVIHLKRFLKVRYNNKINLNVDYPIEGLDMSRYLSQNVETSSRVNTSNCLYDLYGISLHSGTESSGHYVAYAKHPYNHKWHCFNDSLVREIPYSALQDANAYILFYQLRS